MTPAERGALLRLQPLAETEPMAAGIISAIRSGERVTETLASAVTILLAERRMLQAAVDAAEAKRKAAETAARCADAARSNAECDLEVAYMRLRDVGIYYD